jgi:uncharacterized Ntn-hydrolase superfamily protein
MSALLLVLFAAGSPAPPVTPGATATATCVFTNPAFAGKCTQNADLAQGGSPQQACESILRCLNDTACLKTYCQATTIRSGWRLESAK